MVGMRIADGSRDTVFLLAALFAEKHKALSAESSPRLFQTRLSGFRLSVLLLTSKRMPFTRSILIQHSK
jgi:hypothetical protein